MVPQGPLAAFGDHRSPEDPLDLKRFNIFLKGCVTSNNLSAARAIEGIVGLIGKKRFSSVYKPFFEFRFASLF